ncbi:cytosolic sulfotransferase 3-like [Syngnathus typhle]|uniref:cytosolic sulfotransferase 3-like n=1 Tax=Syngnathus typhle TaxID=161592 RepID=UPI002A6A2D8F|nr:cytosolic sulfotransferase 3-like [Syngnathus typhle]XP_061159613.1 cytosolic sulfotransferase 3-like [Syngnathus typhle]
MEAPPRPELFDFHGVPMTKFFTDNWENVKTFKAKPDDIVIATYPKSGTTWVCYLLDRLFFGKTKPEIETSLPLYMRVPFLELCIPGYPKGKDLADQLTITPRLIKTHLPVQLVPETFWENNCKTVYVARNPKDVAVSFFHFSRMNSIHPSPGDWDGFLQRFMEGKLTYGAWHQHVVGWWEKKQTYPNLHYIFYEDLTENVGREIDKLCTFLGLSVSAEEKESIMTAVQFENMRDNKLTNFTNAPLMNLKVSPFMRKGKVGDWRNHFTASQSERCDEHYKQLIRSPGLRFRTEVI